MNNKKCPICGEKNYQLTSNGICPSCEVNLLIFVQDKMDKAQQYKDAASHADSPEDALQEWKQCSKVYQEVLDKYRGTGIDPFSILDPALSLRSVQDECMEKISCYEKMVAESVKSSSSQPVNNRFSFCPYCGNQLSEAFAFCPYCGKSVSAQENTCVPEPPKAQQPVTQQEEIEDEPKQSESFSDSSYSPPWEQLNQTSPNTNYTFSSNEPKKERWGCAVYFLLAIIVVFFLLILPSFFGNSSSSDEPASSNQTNSQSQQENATQQTPKEGSKPKDDGLITYEEYSKIQSDMTYNEVVEIVGSYGYEMSRVELSGYQTVIVAWDGKGSVGANANVTFQNGKVIAKAQFGLE